MQVTVAQRCQRRSSGAVSFAAGIIVETDEGDSFSGLFKKHSAKSMVRTMDTALLFFKIQLDCTSANPQPPLNIV